METSKNGSNGTTAMTVQSSGAIQHGGRYSKEQLDLLKRTIARGTSNDQFALFMGTADRLGLDPFSKHIYAVLRNDKKNPSEKAMTIQVGIDGFRAVADRTGETDGQDGPYWCGDDGIWVDVWLHETPPKGCKVDIYRKGRTRPFRGVATRLSYYQQTNPLWDSMPDNMLAKCAEALGLRKAFPAQLSGVYIPEEMDQAGRVINVEATEVTAPTEKSDPIDTSKDVAALIADIGATTSEGALKKLAPRYNSFPKGGAERKRIYEAWKAQEELLRQAARDDEGEIQS